MTDPDIVDIFKDVVEKVSNDLKILYTDRNGDVIEIINPKLNYIFGNGQYVKDTLDTYSKSEESALGKFPLVALFCPIKETKDSLDYYSKAKVSLLIACSSVKDWSNEQRQVTSFKNILRPIYSRLKDVLQEDSRFDWGYADVIKHSYLENYSYGRYGAYTESGEAVSEPIDAINISSMEIIINNPNCR